MQVVDPVLFDLRGHQHPRHPRHHARLLPSSFNTSGTHTHAHAAKSARGPPPTETETETETDMQTEREREREREASSMTATTETSLVRHIRRVDSECGVQSVYYAFCGAAAGVPKRKRPRAVRAAFSVRAPYPPTLSL
eukprot:315956-Rhodomonas_salina.2